jgi:hypothetical protein
MVVKENPSQQLDPNVAIEGKDEIQPYLSPKK